MFNSFAQELLPSNKNLQSKYKEQEAELKIQHANLQRKEEIEKLRNEKGYCNNKEEEKDDSEKSLLNSISVVKEDSVEDKLVKENSDLK